MTDMKDFEPRKPWPGAGCDPVEPVRFRSSDRGPFPYTIEIRDPDGRVIQRRSIAYVLGRDATFVDESQKAAAEMAKSLVFDLHIP